MLYRSVSGVVLIGRAGGKLAWAAGLGVHSLAEEESC